MEHRIRVWTKVGDKENEVEVEGTLSHEARLEIIKITLGISDD